jgi:phage N-6-adenine-methyltransferase
VSLNTAVMFGKKSDEWTTPADFFFDLNAEFQFVLDAAARRENRKCEAYRGPDHELPEYRNGLVFEWADSTFINPPYSQCGAFIAKAAEQAHEGRTVVALIPSRTDTRWWHRHVWDASVNRCRPGVEIRFIKGRLKFGEGKNSAPFPSVVVVFRPVSA